MPKVAFVERKISAIDGVDVDVPRQRGAVASILTSRLSVDPLAQRSAGDR